jgi:nucleotide-binding universal stress UspA family protein
MRILVASDLSSASDEAVRQGLLKWSPDDQVALCHVLAEAPLHALFPQDYEADLQAQLALQPRIAEALHSQAARLLPGADVPVEIFIEQGSDYAQIIQRADSWQASLVVVGSHGRTGLKRLLIGSVAERVVRYAHCNVLVARPSPAGAVLVATDLSEASLPSIEVGAQEAQRRKCSLVVVHIMPAMPRQGDAAMALLGAIPAVEPPDARQARRELAQEIITNTLQGFGVTGDVRILDGDPLDEVLAVAEALPAELLVIGTKGRSGVSRAVLGSMAADLVQSAPCSVLAVRLPSGKSS